MLSRMTAELQTDAVAEVRAFNRFYTNVMGVLRGSHLDSPYSLTEVRVLYELAHSGPAEGAALRRSLDIDAGYLSRILARFDGEKLTVRERLASDGRRQVIRLTSAGRAGFAELDAKQTEQTAAMLAGLGERDRGRLLEAMRVIREVLPGAGGADGAAGRPRAYLLRPPRPGDLGWVVHRHGAVYAAEYGFNETFEHLVARIVADYAGSRDPGREAAWIAEVDGAPAGCVFCMRKDDATAQLRLLLVEPSARGLGMGARLVDECLRFARSAGYERIMLWTQDCLTAARHVYQRAGFELVEDGKHHSFGQDLVEQIWSRSL
jgi:DNA-binding MarR family transcriptional regulator/ribosomal protein S18 acetylase RimI-like enzyme